jgi:hypothetical protein
MHRSWLMPAISNLLARFGYVKLARYGLVLTPEGRIMSLRPAVLEDGLGGRIVGWPDGDLAAMELQKWEPARPARLPEPATRVAALPPPIPAPKRVAAVPAVAEAPQVDEDEWEWEIALARARVAADEVEAAVAAATAPRVTIPPKSEPVAAKSEPIEFEDRTKTEVTKVRISTGRAPTPAPVTRPAAPLQTRPMPVAVIPPKRPPTVPPTVIPIPKLPTLKDRLPQIQPVVAASNGIPSRARFAKGTGPVEPPAPIRAGDDTQPKILPPAARVVSLPKRSPRS